MNMKNEQTQPIRARFEANFNAKLAKALHDKDYVKTMNRMKETMFMGWLACTCDYQQQLAASPSSHWKDTGEKDPHDNRYDCERAALMLGDHTDDELANEAFMYYDRVLTIEQMLQPDKFKMPIVYMTAVKDRIRWLSRSLEKAIKNNLSSTDLLPHGTHIIFKKLIDDDDFGDGAYSVSANIGDVGEIIAHHKNEDYWVKCVDWNFAFLANLTEFDVANPIASGLDRDTSGGIGQP